MGSDGGRVAVVSENGDFLFVDKPVGWTSFDVVAKIRNTYTALGLKRKVGHCGTLDPKASGLLILATGKKTREIASLEVLDKSYEGAVRLGAVTESHDTETPEYEHRSVEHLSFEEIVAAAAALEGRQMQQPPMHSAVWHQGKRLYELARKGKNVRERKAREIEVRDFRITSVGLPLTHFSVTVSKGAYIRVLAHELGEKLGVGGYLVTLRRTSIGNFSVADSMSVDELIGVIVEAAGREPATSREPRPER